MTAIRAEGGGGLITDRPPYWAPLAALAALERRESTVRVAHLDVDTLLPRPAASSAPRILRFTTRDHTVTVAVLPHPRFVELTIRVTPPSAVGIDVRPLHGTVRSVWADEGGVASCRGVPHGPVSLLVRWPVAAGGPVRTAWTQV